MCIADATNQTAAQSYARDRADIARLLDVMQMELDKHGDEPPRIRTTGASLEIW